MKRRKALSKWALPLFIIMSIYTFVCVILAALFLPPLAVVCFVALLVFQWVCYFMAKDRERYPDVLVKLQLDNHE